MQLTVQSREWEDNGTEQSVLDRRQFKAIERLL
jgi:hypothetical protein